MNTPKSSSSSFRFSGPEPSAIRRDGTTWTTADLTAVIAWLNMNAALIYALIMARVIGAVSPDAQAVVNACLDEVRKKHQTFLVAKGSFSTWFWRCIVHYQILNFRRETKKRHAREHSLDELVGAGFDPTAKEIWEAQSADGREAFQQLLNLLTVRLPELLIESRDLGATSDLAFERTILDRLRELPGEKFEQIEKLVKAKVYPRRTRALELRYQKEMNYVEMAAELDVTEPVARADVSRMLRDLHWILKQLNIDREDYI
ncbi:MAG: DNA-directed RNA polymerase specialized sigma24 family protein [Verrucomicrobiales bacterium]|jgi:DNA-directed RNA polymerase specialized sigma24 family protein